MFTLQIMLTRQIVGDSAHLGGYCAIDAILPLQLDAFKEVGLPLLPLRKTIETTASKEEVTNPRKLALPHV
jgi:hypothetical protein